jgi:tetratricopeptide (TPR) repeat protein
VLDFGLAKLADEEAASRSARESDRSVTLVGQFVGSLPWASPEQAEGRVECIDVRTDVYSLGVMLYQILTGVFPYDVTGSLRDVLERILRCVPARPSAAQNGRSAAIDGELETIVLKCLSKERERRYQSAGELARDIRHYLADEPIEARRDSGWYILRKSLWRYRAPVSVAAVLMLLLAGSAIALTFMYRTQSRERMRAEQALRSADRARQAEQEQRAMAQSRAEEAQAETAKAVAVKQFLQEMLSAADPKQAGGRDVTVREVLDQAARQIENGSLSEQPAVEAEVRGTIAATYASLNLYASAIPHYQWVLDYCTRALGREHLDTLENLRALAGCYSGIGRTSDALPAYEEALDIAERVYGHDHESALHARLGIGGVLVRTHRSDEAEPYFTQALDSARRQFGEEHAVTASALSGLGCVYRDAGRSKAAEEAFRAALAIEEKLHGSESFSAIRLCWILARHVLQVQRRFQEAETLLRDTLDIGRRSLGADHPQTIVVQASLGDLLRIRGNLVEAETLLRDAFTRSREIRGVEDTEILNAAVLLARFLRSSGRRDDAAAVLAEEVGRARATQDEQTLVHLLTEGARYAYEAGDSATAEAWAHEALDLRLKLLGPDHLDLAVNYELIGGYCYDQARFADAAQAYRQAADIRRRRLGDTDPATVESVRRLTSALCFSGEAQTALGMMRDLHAALSAKFGEDHRRTQAAFKHLANLMSYDGQHAARASLHREVLARWRQKFGGRSARAASMLSQLGRDLLAAGEAAGAEETLREALSIYDEPGRARSPTAALVRAHWAEALIEVHRLDEAELNARSALEALRAAVGTDDTRALLAQRVLGVALLRNGDALQAEPLLRECVSTLSAMRPTPSRAASLVLAHIAQAECLMALQRFDEAEELLRRATELQRKYYGVWPVRIAMVESLLGDCLTRAGKFEDAETLLICSFQAIQASDWALPQAQQEEVVRRLVYLYQAWHKPDQAAAYRAAP